ncbi:hypothetical protein AMI01nite_52490 [Aneurinibacillus migulanus]|nr:hypothetical protein AMI01nite_52490 [Aneurinibacillus migulanus]
MGSIPLPVYQFLLRGTDNEEKIHRLNGCDDNDVGFCSLVVFLQYN